MTWLFAVPVDDGWDQTFATGTTCATLTECGTLVAPTSDFRHGVAPLKSMATN